MGKITPSADRLNKSRDNLRKALEADPILQPHSDAIYKALDEFVDAKVKFLKGGF